MRHEPTRRALLLLGLGALGGCVGPAWRPDNDRPPTDSQLRQIANSSRAGKGGVDVSLVDGVAYVTGDVENAIDEHAIVRQLRRVDGVERVVIRVRREM